MSYNIIRKDISNGLQGRQLSSLGAGNYLILRYAPAGANVKVRLGSQNAQAIDMIQDDTIETTADAVYVEADAVAGEHIIFAQAKTSKDFRITPAPAIKNLTVDNFFIPNQDNQYTILAGANQVINTSTMKAIRFLATDTVGVSLNSSGIKYEMLEDEIFTRDITSLQFFNDTTASITLTTWEQ